MLDKRKKKVIIIISSLILVLICILIIIISINKKYKNKEELQEKVSSYTSMEEFETIEEVASFLGCVYKKQDVSKDNNYRVDVYMQIKIMPYNDDKSNEGFYKKLIAYSANALKYESYRIIDEKKDILIEVICDSENKKINAFYINGESDYFAKKESNKQLKNLKEVKETNINIQSSILNKLIDSNWLANDADFGTKESYFNNYDIYFDEGIEVRKIDSKVFNIVFNSKYKEKIANDITVNSNKTEIISKLGEPSFQDDRYDFIGYKGKEIYLFYNSNKEISIYRVQKNSNNNQFAKLVDEYIEKKEEEKLIQSIKEKYSDYDKYEADSNGVILQYALKGVCIKFKKGISNGIEIFSNYKGKIYENVSAEDLKTVEKLPDGIIINNEDLVAKTELERIQNIQNFIFSSSDERSKKPEISQSEKYATIKEPLDENSYNIKFLSLDKKNANSELKENINYYVWIDNDNFVYSIENRGIYVYNVTSRKYTTLITGSDEKFEIKEYKDNILKYDNKRAKITK